LSLLLFDFLQKLEPGDHDDPTALRAFQFEIDPCA
jgi:hypothetical protein